MATIYRFQIEQQESRSGGRKSRDTNESKRTTAKKLKSSSNRGGVEHNRKMRALNPMINKMTGGAWEKGMRFSRAAFGIRKEDKNGNMVFSTVAIAIIAQMFINYLLNYQRAERLRAQRENNQNFKQLENGYGSIHGSYEISTNILTGRHTYNQNK